MELRLVLPNLIEIRNIDGAVVEHVVPFEEFSPIQKACCDHLLAKDLFLVQRKSSVVVCVRTSVTDWIGTKHMSPESLSLRELTILQQKEEP